MPTFSAIELENLVQPRGVRDAYKKPLASSPPRAPGTLHGRETDAPNPPPPLRHIYISPALYATPEPAPIPETVTEPLSPSPYVLNHKRRGGGTGAFGNRRGNIDGIEVPAGEQVEKKEKEEEGADLIEAVEDEEKEAVTTEVADEKFSGDGANGFFVKKTKEEEEEDGFLDTRGDSVSVGSETEGIRQFDSRSFLSSTHGEFFDAIEG